MGLLSLENWLPTLAPIMPGAVHPKAAFLALRSFLCVPALEAWVGMSISNAKVTARRANYAHPDIRQSACFSLEKTRV